MTHQYARSLACSTLTLALALGIGCSGDENVDAADSMGQDAAGGGSGRVKPGDPATAVPGSGATSQPTAAGEAVEYPDLRGKCSIQSGYASDEACISAPAAEEGMQVHVGPTDYANTDEVKPYLLMPGEEVSECWTFRVPNDKDVWYQTSVLSGRAGTHHIINTMYDASSTLEEGGFRRCAGDQQSAIGSLPGASKAYMPRGHVAPEYQGVGRKIPAGSIVTADMHYFNFTDKPLLREFWMNIYYAKEEDIDQEAEPIRGLGGFSWNQQPIAPGTDMVYKYSCPVKGEGFILTLLGHYHAHGKRFTSTITRAAGGEEKVFEMFDYLEPATFEYNSVVENPSFAPEMAGAVSGQLAVHDGDVLNWECHIINDSMVGLTYRNEVMTGEMCNLWGASLGIERLSCFIP